MNQSFDILSLNLLNMLRGALLMKFISMCVGLYPKRKDNPVQNYLFWILAVMSGFLLVSFGYMIDELRNNQIFRDFKTLLDFCLVPMISSFFLKIVIPDRFSGRKAFLMLVPAIIFMTIYTFTQEKLLMTLAFAYSILVVVVVFSFVVYVSFRYERVLKNNFSNIENKSIGWVRTTIFIFAAWYVAWMIVAMNTTNNWVNSIYYLFLISIWVFIYRHSIRHIAAVRSQELFEEQQIAESSGTTKAGEADSAARATNVAGAANTLDPNSINEPDVAYPFESDLADETEGFNTLGIELGRYMSQEQPWLNPSLTLQELATALNTNRTYLSEFLNNSLKTTFYDYINSFRIRRACEILVSEPELSLMVVGERSGFNSLSTFRRAFEKYVGCTPAVYRNSK